MVFVGRVNVLLLIRGMRIPLPLFLSRSLVRWPYLVYLAAPAFKLVHLEQQRSGQRQLRQRRSAAQGERKQATEQQGRAAASRAAPVANCV